MSIAYESNPDFYFDEIERSVQIHGIDKTFDIFTDKGLDEDEIDYIIGIIIEANPNIDF